MGKEDWYFIVGTVLAILALLGMDWKLVAGRISMQPSQIREILLLMAVIGSLAMSGIGWYKSTRRDYLHWTMTQDQEEVVYGKTFRNETVEIDGKKFDHCKFENVTLMYHALAPADFVEATWSGNLYVVTDNDAAKGFALLAEQARQTFALLPGRTFGIGSVDKHGNIAPITIPPPKINK